MKFLYLLIIVFVVISLVRGEKTKQKNYNSNLETLVGKDYDEIEKLFGKPYQFGTMDFGMAYGKWEINGEKIELFFRENTVESIERLS